MGQAATTRTAVGVDIGGTGIKAGIVDLDAGALTSGRVKVPTPAGAEPADESRGASVETHRASHSGQAFDSSLA